MSAVCRSWQAIDVKINKKIKSPLCLMLAETEKNEKFCFYNVSEEIFVELDLSEIRGRRCWGSPFGWLVTCGLDLQIQLFNPLSGAVLPLPSIRDFPPCPELLEDRPPEFWGMYFIHKLILCSNPVSTNSADCIVLAIHLNDQLAFAKPGDQKWIQIDNIDWVEDAIYFQGNIYACTRRGDQISLCDVKGSHPKASNFASLPSDSALSRAMTKYLFDLDGNLCLASRTSLATEEEVEDEDEEYEMLDVERRYISFEFTIFKLDMQAKIWEKIYSLGDRSLFLGNCMTFTVVAADYPGCKPNFIYFTDDQYSCMTESADGLDIGTYDCQNIGRDWEGLYFHDLVEFFPKSKDVHHLLPSRPYLSPLWIIP